MRLLMTRFEAMRDGSLGTVWMRPLMGAVRFADAHGIPLETVVSGTMLRAAMLTRPEGRIPITWVEVLFTRLAELSGEPDVGLRCSEHIEPSELDVYYYFGSSCENVGEALQAFASAARLLNTSAECSIADRGGEVALTLGTGFHNTSERHGTEYSMACIMSGLARIAAVPVMPRRVTLRHSGHANENHTRVFGCPVELDSGLNALVYDASVMRAPTLAPDATLKELVRRQVQLLLEQLPAIQSFASELRGLVVGALPTGELNLGWIAKQVAMSPRTFQRYLSAETQKSFRDFVDDVRKELAPARLEDPRRSIAEVAYGLGYNDSRAFARAFQRWYGHSPSTQRAHR